MEKKTVKIVLKLDGTETVHLEGFKGSQCEELRLLELLRKSAEILAEEKTADYDDERPVSDVGQVQVW